MNNLKFLGKATIIYLLGNVLTRIIGFLMIRVYTVYITPNDFGKYDVTLTYILLISSIVFFDIWNGIMKFYFEKKETEAKNKIVSNGIMIFLTSIILYTVTFGVAHVFLDFEFMFLVYIYGILISLQNLYGYASRMMKFNKAFMFSGILSSLLNSGLVFLLLSVFKMGYESMYIGFIVGIIVQVLFLNYYVKLHKYFKKDYIDKSVIKNLFIYSLPLSINSAAYWLLTGFGKIYISHVLGEEYNGYLAIAAKFAIFITLISTAFTMAWQELSFRKFEKTEKNIAFFNQFSKFFMELLIFSSVFIMALIYFIFPYMVTESYTQSKTLIPLYLSSTTFSILSTFFGTILLTFKVSKWISISTISAAVVNVLVNVLFLQRFGIIIAPIALLVAWFVNATIRIITINKVITFKPVSFKLFVFMAMLGGSIHFFDLQNKWYIIMYSFICLLLGLLLYYRDIKSGLRYLKKGVNIEHEN